jgi:hypothetical protein
MGRAAHSAAAKDGEPLRDERCPGWAGIECVVLRAQRAWLCDLRLRLAATAPIKCLSAW